MALLWDFKQKAGTVTEVQDGREFTLNFYEGNALMIVTYEFSEGDQEKYQMMWFFVSEDHARNCLGLQKSTDGKKVNMFGENGITHLTIYREHCRQWKTIVTLFTRAFPNIEIDLRAKAPEGSVTHE